MPQPDDIATSLCYPIACCQDWFARFDRCTELSCLSSPSPADSRQDCCICCMMHENLRVVESLKYRHGL